MAYTITFELSKPNKRQERKVYILVIENGKKFPRIDTNVRITGTLKSASDQVKNIINKKKNEIEKGILESIQRTGAVKIKEKSNEYIQDYWEEKRKHIVRSENRIKAITSAVYNFPNFQFKDVSESFIEKLHRELIDRKKIDGSPEFQQNTIWSYMQRLRAVLQLAEKDKLLAEDQFADYEFPGYQQGVPVFLLEEEIAAFHEVVKGIKDRAHLVAGYRFLLSCYAGYRISDAIKFTPEEYVNGDTINLRADKNGRIVSIAIHSRLKAIIDWIRDNPECSLAEQTIRDYVKELAKLAGIRKHVKFHTARHSFAMFLTKNGFHVEEVAEFLGDDIRAAKIYARLWNENLNKKVIERLG